ncbi:MAG: alpha/beta hydrolase family protein [Ktedonobacterales bacterium]
MSDDILTIQPPPADTRLRYGQSKFHFGDLRLPAGAGPHPVVVGIHGGFWRARYDLTHFSHVCAALTAAGIATWNIEYRRLGNIGGGWPNTLLDVAHATDHLRVLAKTYPLDLSRVVTLGHSAGGHLALWVAAHRHLPAGNPLHTSNPLLLRAAVSLAGVVDLRRAWELRLSNGVVKSLIGGTPEKYPDRYAAASPIELLPIHIRQVLIHGDQDDTVPIEISRHYRDAAHHEGDDVTLVELPGAGHYELIDPRSREWPTVLHTVQTLLS